MKTAFTFFLLSDGKYVNGVTYGLKSLANKGKFIKIKVRYEPICMRRRKKMFKFKNEAYNGTFDPTDNRLAAIKEMGKLKTLSDELAGDGKRRTLLS